MQTGWRWHALKIEPGSEFAVQRRLARAGFNDTFLPLLHTPKRAKRTQLIARPRLPGYLFIGTNNALPWAELLDVKGVIDILRHGDEPAAFTARQMHALVLSAQRPRHVAGGAARIRSRGKKQQDTAQITSGPYAGHVVRIVSTQDDGELLYAFTMRNYTLNAEHSVIHIKGGNTDD